MCLTLLTPIPSKHQVTTATMGNNTNSGSNIAKRALSENTENANAADLKEKNRLAMLKRSNTATPDVTVSTPQANAMTPMVRSRRALTEVPVNHQRQQLQEKQDRLQVAKVRREHSDLSLAATSRKRNVYRDEDVGEKSVKKAKTALQIQWKDLDHEEKTDICMVTEYTDEIFEHLYRRELETLPTHNYLTDADSAYHLRPSMRAILVDWLVEVHEKFQCYPETLFLTINIMDRFLSKNKVTLSKLQLLAVTSLFIAAKFEEVNLPKLSDYAYITDGAASKQDIKSAEMFMLTSLSFDIGWPNPMNFLRRISKADSYDFQTRCMGKFLLEYAMCSHKFVEIKPSLIAAMSMFVARKIAGRQEPVWDETFQHYSGDIDALHDADFLALCKELVHEIACPQTKLDSLILKFKKPKFGAIYYKVHDWCHEQVENDRLDSLFSL